MTSSLQKNTEKIIRKNFLLAALQVKQKLALQHKRLFEFGSPFWPGFFSYHDLANALEKATLANFESMGHAIEELETI